MTLCGESFANFGSFLGQVSKITCLPFELVSHLSILSDLSVNLVIYLGFLFIGGIKHSLKIKLVSKRFTRFLLPCRCKTITIIFPMSKELIHAALLNDFIALT